MPIDLPPILATAASLGTAFLLGGLIGLERQFRQRTAGLRTNVLVAVGAATFVDLGLRMAGQQGATQIVAYVVSGIGFLGAGVIMKEGTQVRGLNTAATLWASAAVGASAGAKEWATAALVAVFVLAGNTLLRPLVDIIDRRPITAGETEALYRVHLTCAPENVAASRDLLSEELERHHYPVREIETLSEGDERVELAALLVPTSAEPAELDLVVTQLEANSVVLSATWSVSAMS